MIYYLYEIRNLVNNKIYVGVHKTKDVNDGYMGSGKIIVSAIKKYGIENFTKIILETFNTSEDMYCREKELVTDEFLARDNTYNLRRGGFGGFDYLNNWKDNPTHTSAHSRMMNSAQSPELREKHSKILMAGFYNKLAKNNGKLWYSSPKFTGKQHSPETKELMSRKAKGKQAGDKNSQFGTCWVTNGVESKKIKSAQINEYLVLGYVCGRKIK